MSLHAVVTGTGFAKDQISRGFGSGKNLPPPRQLGNRREPGGFRAVRAPWGARMGGKTNSPTRDGYVRTDQGLSVGELVVAALLEDLQREGEGTKIRGNSSSDSPRVTKRRRVRGRDARRASGGSAPPQRGSRAQRSSTSRFELENGAAIRPDRPLEGRDLPLTNAVFFTSVPHHGTRGFTDAPP